MALSPEKIKIICDSGLKRLKERFEDCSHGHVKSCVEGWMVDIGKNGNISPTYCLYDWEKEIEWAKP